MQRWVDYRGGGTGLLLIAKIVGRLRKVWTAPWWEGQHHGLPYLLSTVALLALIAVGFFVLFILFELFSWIWSLVPLVHHDSSSTKVVADVTILGGLAGIEDLKFWLSRWQLWAGLLFIAVLVGLAPHVTWTNIVSRRINGDASVAFGENTTPKLQRERAEAIALDLRVRSRRLRAWSATFLLGAIAILLGGFYFVLFLAPLLDQSDERQRAQARLRTLAEEVESVIGGSNGWFHIQPFDTAHVEGLEVLDPTEGLIVAWLRGVPEIAVSSDGFAKKPHVLDFSEGCGFAAYEVILDLQVIDSRTIAILGDQGTLSVCTVTTTTATLVAVARRNDGPAPATAVVPQLFLAVAQPAVGLVSTTVAALHSNGEVTVLLGQRARPENRSADQPIDEPPEAAWCSRAGNDNSRAAWSFGLPMGRDKLIGDLTLRFGERLTVIDVSPDGKTLLFVGSQGSVGRWEIRYGQLGPPSARWCYSKQIMAVRFSSNRFADADSIIESHITHTNELVLYVRKQASVLMSVIGGSISDLRASENVLDDERLLGLFDFDESILVAYGSKPSLAVSLNGGVAWPNGISFNAEGHFEEFELLWYAFLLSDGETLVPLGDEGSVVVSPDLGNTWPNGVKFSTEEHFQVSELLLNVILLGDGDTLAAFGDEGSVVISLDSGASWSKELPPNISTSLESGLGLKRMMLLGGGETLAAFGDKGSVVISPGLGKTWTNGVKFSAEGCFLEFEWLQKVILLSDGETLAAIGTDGSLVVSSDFGKAWQGLDEFRLDPEQLYTSGLLIAGASKVFLWKPKTDLLMTGNFVTGTQRWASPFSPLGALDDYETDVGVKSCSTGRMQRSD